MKEKKDKKKKKSEEVSIRSSKAISYYDWELPSKISKERETRENSLGISDTQFKEFIKKWKEKNLR